jgi:solute carrier family 12 (sodium/potassium/chloride transporter), member 2
MSKNIGLSNGKFGTFKGVYLPSVLTVLGVIMYLRMGWVVGNLGLFKTVLIVLLSSSITFIAGMSISSIATNMNVKGGGAYYMISRSFGIEAGSAVGIPLFFAQAIGTAFYVIGFTESIKGFFPNIPFQIIAVTSLFLLLVLAYISADLALKAQFLIFIFVIASLFSLFLGGAPSEGFASSSSILPAIGFWPVFAVFFPAVTGILSGVSMSGDLKNPSRSLPKGTIAAVLTGAIVYLAVPIFLISVVPIDVLRTDNMIMQKIAASSSLILIGIWGATFSSALGSILSAPRTLQALARDRAVPSFFARVGGKSSSPRIATLFTFFIALIVILMGDLNQVASVLSMFFLATYGALNLISGFESLIGNPSWRPSFKVPWYISFIGAVLCFGVMLLINVLATFIAILIIFLFYYISLKRNMESHWVDIRRAILVRLASFSIFELIKYNQNARTWYPNILVFSGSPQKRFHLIHLADAITHGRGFISVISVLKNKELEHDKVLDFEKVIQKHLKDKNISALVEVANSEDYYTSAKEYVRTYGIGALTPNIYLMGSTDKEENFFPFAELIQTVYKLKKNLIILRDRKTDSLEFRDDKQIVIWWGGQHKNQALMLAIGHMLKTNPSWQGSRLIMRTIVRNEEEKEYMLNNLKQFLKSSRIEAIPEVIVETSSDDFISGVIKKHSQDVDLVLMGIRPPEEGESTEDYSSYYRDLFYKSEGLPHSAFILAGEDVDFKKIFLDR